MGCDCRTDPWLMCIEYVIGTESNNTYQACIDIMQLIEDPAKGMDNLVDIQFVCMQLLASLMHIQLNKPATVILLFSCLPHTVNTQ